MSTHPDVTTSMATEAVDERAPQLQSAVVDGSTLTLTYDEALDTAPPARSAFTVHVNGKSRSIVAAGVGESRVLLGLATPVAAGDTVTVDYAAPAGAGKVQDPAGNAAGSFSGRPVTNSTGSSRAGGSSGESGNSPATGAPAITGTAQAGETLAAVTTGIADSDGLDNVDFQFQWLANDGSTDTDISGATSSSYTLADTDVGKTVKVRVSFTDDAGNSETLTSTATGAVAAAPTPLTASTHDMPDGHDGENAFTFELRFSETPVSNFSYRTLRDHAFTVTGGTVTSARRLARPANVRWEITVKPSSDAEVSIVLPATTDCADQGAICTEDGRMLSAEVSLTVAGPVEEEDLTPPENNPATGVPTISGTAQAGETLTAVHHRASSDSDGLDNVVFQYQWGRQRRLL